MNKFTILKTDLVALYQNFQETSTTFELFEIIFKYVELLEQDKKISKWLNKELTRKEKDQDYLIKLRNKRKTTQEERDQYYIFNVLTNIWHTYGFFKAVHDGVNYNHQKKKPKKDYYTSQGLAILAKYADLTENIGSIKKIELTKDFKQINNQIFTFLERQAKEEAKTSKKAVKKENNIAEEQTQNNPNNSQEKCSDINYRFDLENKAGWFNFAGQEIYFSGRVAIIFYFFYALNKVEDENYKTYHDFKNYIKEQNINVSVNSVNFSQSISAINARIKENIKELKSVIKRKENASLKLIANRYKWQMQI